MKDLLFDLGSTNVKWYIDDNTKGDYPFPSKIDLPDPYFEVNPILIINPIIDMIEKEKPDRVFISTQMHGYILLDGNGKEVSNYISWQDKRATLINIPFDVPKTSGSSKKGNLPKASIYMMEKMFPEKIKDAKEYCTLGSYIVKKLTGSNVTHSSDACPSGFYDVKSLNGESSLILPKVTRDVEFAGMYKETKIYTPVGDQQAAILGSDSTTSDYIMNIGTAGQLCAISKDYIEGDFESRPYFDGMTLCTITNLYGGKLILENDNWLSEFKKCYSEALNKLPKKDKIIVSGGYGKRFKDEISLFLDELGFEYSFSKKDEAIIGLKKIAENIKEEKKMQKGIMISEDTFPNLPIILKNSGLDFFILDCEHGGFDYKEISAIVVNANLVGIKCIIRLPNNCRKDITKFMDMGAKGLLLPMTNTADDIKEVVKYAKYYPIGQRGLSTMRAHTLYNPPELLGYMKSSNDVNEIYAQIETKSGVEHVDEILAVEGVTGCFIGPNDLSCDLECLGKEGVPIICGVIEKVGKACKKAKKIGGIITGKQEYLEKGYQSGLTSFSVGSELNLLASGAKNTVNKINDLAK